ncbi:shikimate dehydrogenase [Thalassomonas haliotis]|uniref:Shikimate dehydrogenase (NADP(+)) n=1 Tax=Thalassomonas haliotis TaxID=485448 RepID=A0ABY7VE24_9GAMM|nr:shikimate dehydrogenase [Thalassomonas haliotis]WDE11942.1 shikimate dehydrogenase [Thalassomonas haliotis]
MDQYRVFGNPIKHSRSPYIHQAFAEETQQQLTYQSQLVALDAFAATIKDFAQAGGKGGNVTVPFKEQALALCDQVSKRASLAGAVNTLSFRDGQILGDNTDGIGLVKDLLANKVTLTNRRILLIGAGGAAKGVVLPLLEQNPAQLVIANRTLSKAQQICQLVSDNRLSCCTFEHCNNYEFDVIINATSASLDGHLPAIPEQVIARAEVCYDMVYAKQLTPFLHWAKESGANKVIDGLGMLVAQAAESFNIWRGVMPSTDEVLQRLRADLT